MSDYIDRGNLVDQLRKSMREIEILDDDEKAFMLGVHQGILFAISDVKKAPAVTLPPERTAGWNWVKLYDDFPRDVGEYRCSKCDCLKPNGAYTNYCPKCGAKMR